MASIESTIQLYDRITAPVNNMLSALNNLCGAYEEVDAEMQNGFDRSRIDSARAAIDQAAQQVDACRQEIEESTQSQEKFNEAIRRGADNANSLQGLIGKAAGALGAFFGFRKIIDFSTDSMKLFNTQLNAETQLMTVLGNMVEDDYVLEVMAETNTASAIADINSIQDSIDGAAAITLEAKTAAVEKQFEALTPKAAEIQGRGIYGDEIMIAGAAELSTYFTDTDAIEVMMDTLTNYAMGMSGGGALDSTAMTNYATGLGKIMSGAYDAMTKKGFKFTDAQKAVIEGTATEAEYIAVLGEQYQAMSDDMRAATAITQVVNEAWGGLYETMSNTPEGKIIQLNNAWGDMKEAIGGQIYPYVLRFVDIIQNNWGTIEQIVNGITEGLQFMFGVLSWIAEGALNVADFFVDNWSVIEPIIMGVVAALGAYLLVAGIVNTINGVMATIEGVKAAAQMMATGATFAETAAQQGLNAALLACPITWIIIMIIALIAIIYAVVAAINKATGSTISATGIIAGLFAMLGAHIINRFVVPVWNKIASFANFLGNALNDPIAAIKVLFYDMCLTGIGYVRNLAQGIENLINKIPGISIDITSGLDSLYSSLEKLQQNVKDESGWIEYVGKLDYIDYEDAWNAGYSFGEGIDESIANFDPSSLFRIDNVPDPKDYINRAIGDRLDDITRNTAETADALYTSDEDLKYLRDIAERETINRFTTAEIKIEWNNTQNISSEMDLDGVVEYLTEGFQEAMESAAEGVHV